MPARCLCAVDVLGAAYRRAGIPSRCLIRTSVGLALIQMHGRRRHHLVALLLYYVLLTAGVLLLAKATPCRRETGDGAAEKGFKRFACALVLAARMPEIAARKRLGVAAAVLAEWALLETRRVLVDTGVRALANPFGHVYLASLSTCFLVFSIRRRHALALVAKAACCAASERASSADGFVLPHKIRVPLWCSALDGGVCSPRISVCRGALQSAAQAAPMSAANAKQTRI